eukprot:COSAG02_NODE_4201_length_5632_cov_5.111874_6_plen_84_part_00
MRHRASVCTTLSIARTPAHSHDEFQEAYVLATLQCSPTVVTVRVLYLNDVVSHPHIGHTEELITACQLLYAMSSFPALHYFTA